eukprot:jgi/Mesvir1/15230/Mv25032-RA.1
MLGCNACGKELDKTGVVTACGHLFCEEDASKILQSESACPRCDQILSKASMKAIQLDPSDATINMMLAGLPPHTIMKTAYKGVVFWIGQKDAEAEVFAKKYEALRQKFQDMQQKCVEKLEQVHGGYQKAMAKYQAAEQEKQALVKDKNELQEKYSEKCRQKRKLEEMYDSLRADYEQLYSQIHGGAAGAYGGSGADVAGNHRALIQPGALRGGQAGMFAGRPLGGAQAQKEGAFAQMVAESNDVDHFLNSGSGKRPRHDLATDDAAMFKPFNSNSFLQSRPGSAGGNPAKMLRSLLLSPMRRPTSKVLGATSR